MSFADSSPVMITSEASVELLNSKLDTPLPIDRFRPNIIVSGCEPHAEVSSSQIELAIKISCAFATMTCSLVV